MYNSREPGRAFTNNQNGHVHSDKIIIQIKNSAGGSGSNLVDVAGSSIIVVSAIAIAVVINRIGSMIAPSGDSLGVALRCMTTID